MIKNKEQAVEWLEQFAEPADKTKYHDYYNKYKAVQMFNELVDDPIFQLGQTYGVIITIIKVFGEFLNE